MTSLARFACLGWILPGGRRKGFLWGKRRPFCSGEGQPYSSTLKANLAALFYELSAVPGCLSI